MRGVRGSRHIHKKRRKPPEESSGDSNEEDGENDERRVEIEYSGGMVRGRDGHCTRVIAETDKI